jgi:hypothetical protein
MGGTITSGVDFSARRARVRGRTRESTPEGPTVVLHPGPFVHATLVEEATRLGITVEELVTFAVLYFLTDRVLADRDAQRNVRDIPPSARPAKQVRTRGAEPEDPDAP